MSKFSLIKKRLKFNCSDFHSFQNHVSRYLFSASIAVNKRYQHIKLSGEYCTDIKILVLTHCLFLYFALPPLLLDATSRATRSLYTCT